MKISATIIGFILFFCALTLTFVPKTLLVPRDVGLCLAFLSFVVFMWLLQKKYHFPILNKGIFCFFVWCVGISFFHAPAIELRQLAEKNLQLPQHIEGEIEIKSVLKQQNYHRVIGEILLPTNSKPQLVYLNWKEELLPDQGELWLGKVRLYPLAARLNDGGFDRLQWFFAHKITATGTVKTAKLIKKSTGFRESLISLAKKQSEDLTQQGLLLALAFGERAWLSHEVMAVYQQTNTAHLIAISGLHIGLSLAFGYWFGRGIQWFFPSHKISPLFPRLVGIIFAGFYAFLAGFQVTTLRAFFALTFWLWLYLGRRFLLKWEVFLWVAVLLLILDPLSVLSGSFWLSFFAVGSLILWYHFFPLSFFIQKTNTEKFSISLKIMHLLKQLVLGLCHLQFGLLWLFTPVQLCFFNGINIFSPLINLFFVPLFSFLLVPLILLATLTLGFNQPLLWQLADALAVKIFQALNFFSHFWLNISVRQSVYLSLFCAMTFLLALGFKYQKKIIAFAGVAVVVLITLFGSYSEKPQWKITMLDVGQGLAVLVEKNGRAVLYDTGNRWQGGSMASIEIIPYLYRQGLTLDEVILSHDDQDHAGGLMDLLNEFPDLYVRAGSFNVLTKVYQQKSSAPRIEKFLPFAFKPCLKGEQWQWQGLSFKALWAEKLQLKTKNEDSCVVMVSDGIHTALLMGDATKKEERALLAEFYAIDVLQVGHHGSLTSSDELFLTKIKPKIAMVSASRWNPWHHPHPKIKQRFAKHKIPLLNTGNDGSLHVSLFKDRFETHSARGSFSPWYRLSL